MRRSHVLIGLAVAAVAAGAVAVVLAKRTTRWNDARTMPPPLEAAVRASVRGDDAAALAAVRRLLVRYRAPAWEPSARLLAAHVLDRAGRAREIATFLPKELPDTQPLATHAALLRARGLLADGRFEAAADSAGRAAAVPGFPRRDEALAVRAEALDRLGRWQEGVRALAGSSSVDAAVAAARIAGRHGDRAHARAALAAAALGAAPGDLDALEEAFPAVEPSPADRFDAASLEKLLARSRRLLDDGNPDAALRLARLAHSPGAPGSPEAALVEAEAAIKTGALSDARGLLARARAGGSAERAGAAFLDARVAGLEGRSAPWRAGMTAVARTATSPWRERALLELARAAEGLPSRAALDAYRRYRLAAGGGADPLALLREAWAAEDLGIATDADAAWRRALSAPGAPDGVVVTSRYWIARRDDARGRAAAARDAYAKIADDFPNHYYGLLAARRLGRGPVGTPPPDPPRVEPAMLGPSGRWLASARAWDALGVWDEASRCYAAALEGSPPDRGTAVALEAATRAEASHARAEAIGFAQRAIGDRDRRPPSAVPRDLWRLLLPAPPTPVLEAEAKRARLDPHLLAAVALQESAWNPLAVSSAGARGLLQLMPPVGAEMARRLGLKGFRPDDLFDPDVNARLGCAHFADYLREFDGSIPKTLAAYNAGPSRVERWTLPRGRDDDERFVERIPFPETRLYVKRISSNAALYAVAWPDGFAAASR